MSPLRIVVLLCCAEVLSMTTFSTFPGLLPTLLSEWHLTNAEAGVISGMFFAGYMAAVPVLAGLTDRIDARRVYLFACALSVVGSLGFAYAANGAVSASLCQALIGAGLAGTYMPGLKLLSDLIEESPARSRFVAFYTATFGIGSAASLLIVGLVQPEYGWRPAFAVSAIGPLAAGALVWLTLPPSKVMAHSAQAKHLLDFRPVFRSRAVTGYILGYTVHCYELFALRSWIVAFLAFSATMQPAHDPLPWHPAWIVAAITPLVIPASLLGNEVAARYGRRNVVLTILGLSAVTACTVGFLAAQPWPIVLTAYTIYLVLTMADSSALTNGVIAEASPHLRGATMAAYSFLGFGAGLIAPIVFGAVLDVAGGNNSVFAWGLAFASLAIGGLGPVALLVSKYRLRTRAA